MESELNHNYYFPQEYRFIIPFIPFKKTEHNSEYKMKKPIIFTIKKVIKRGRRKLCCFYPKKAKHDKHSCDNIIRRIKTYFINSAMNYINKKYDEFLSIHNCKKGRLLQKINPNFHINPKFLETNISQIFSENLSERCKNYIPEIPEYNRKQIESLYKKNEAKEVIQIMNKKVCDLYLDYIRNTIPEFSLNNDLIKIREKNGNKYSDRFEKIAKNLIGILNKNKKKIKN